MKTIKEFQQYLNAVEYLTDQGIMLPNDAPGGDGINSNTVVLFSRKIKIERNFVQSTMERKH